MTSRSSCPVLRRSARGGLRLTTAVLVAALLAACSTPPPPGTLPDMPSGVTAPDEYAFGDDVASRDLRASGPVHDVLVEEVDAEKLRSLPLVLEVDVDAAAVRDAYADELVGRGWASMPDLPAGDDAWTQGWISADGRDVLVLVGLEPEAGEAHVPLTVLTTLPDEAAEGS